VKKRNIKKLKYAQHKGIKPPPLGQQVLSVSKVKFTTLDVLFFRAD
jgi:hypothetical protein